MAEPEQLACDSSGDGGYSIEEAKAKLPDKLHKSTLFNIIVGSIFDNAGSQGVVRKFLHANSKFSLFSIATYLTPSIPLSAFSTCIQSYYVLHLLSSSSRSRSSPNHDRTNISMVVFDDRNRSVLVAPESMFFKHRRETRHFRVRFFNRNRIRESCDHRQICRFNMANIDLIFRSDSGHELSLQPRGLICSESGYRCSI